MRLDMLLNYKVVKDLIEAGGITQKKVTLKATVID